MRIRKLLKHMTHHGLDPNIEYVENHLGELIPRFESKLQEDSTLEVVDDTKENTPSSPAQGIFDEDSKFTVPEVAKTVVKSLNETTESPSENDEEPKKTTKRKPPPPRKKKLESPTQV